MNHVSKLTLHMTYGTKILNHTQVTLWQCILSIATHDTGNCHCIGNSRKPYCHYIHLVLQTCIKSIISIYNHSYTLGASMYVVWRIEDGGNGCYITRSKCSQDAWGQNYKFKLCKSAISYIGNVSWAAQSPDLAQTAGHKPSTHGLLVTPTAAHIF